MQVQFHDPNWRWKVSTQSACLLCPQLVLSGDFELVGETESISMFLSRRPWASLVSGLALFKKVTDTKSFLIRVQKSEELNICLLTFTHMVWLSSYVAWKNTGIHHKAIKWKHSGCWSWITALVQRYLILSTKMISDSELSWTHR